MKRLVIFTLLAAISVVCSTTTMNKIHDYSRSNLIKLVIAAQQKDRENRNITLILGGVEDYIYSMNSSEIKYILAKFVLANKELNDIEYFENYANITSMPEGLYFNQTLSYMSRLKLESYAFACEIYSRKNVTIFGGLHDYIDTLQEDDLIKYILNVTGEYKELLENNKLEEISKIESVQIEDLRDLLASLQKYELAVVAITADEYDREHTGKRGGIAEYVYTLTEAQIIDIIVEKATKYPELRVERFFKSLIQRYEERVSFANFYHASFLIQKLTKNDLLEIAYACEKFENSKSSQSFKLGGLHDYAWKLSEDALRVIILDYLRAYPELTHISFLEELLTTVKLVVKDNLTQMPIETLQIICVNLESYDKDARNKYPDGGIHDYVTSLSKNDLLNYIFKMLERYPNLNTVGELEAIVEKYNVQVHEH